MPTSVASAPTRTSVVSMKAPLAPKGAFGGSKKPGTPSGWLGDRSQGDQIKAYEEGTDFLFFQGPAPKTAVQPDLPSFFSIDNFAGADLKPQAIVAAATGFGSLAVLAPILLGSTLELPKAPAGGAPKLPGLPAISAPKLPSISAPKIALPVRTLGSNPPHRTTA